MNVRKRGPFTGKSRKTYWRQRLRGEDGRCLFSALKVGVWVKVLSQRFPFLQSALPGLFCLWDVLALQEVALDTETRD